MTGGNITVNRGLTIIEVLLVIGLLAILTGLVPLSLDFYKSQQLNTHSHGIVRTLRRAQLKAMAIEDDSSFGVYLTNDNYVLFKGRSWADRDPQFDQVFDLPQVISLIGLSEVVFSKLEGRPSVTGSITLISNGNANIISINKLGRVNFELAPAPFCTGTPFPCEQFTDQTPCQDHGGCSWTAAFCGGTCTPCSGLDQTQCTQQDGCRWFFFFCRGNCTSCGTYTDQPSCQGQLGCFWNPGECQSIPFSCEGYTTQAECGAQEGCQWVAP